MDDTGDYVRAFVAADQALRVECRDLILQAREGLRAAGGCPDGWEQRASVVLGENLSATVSGHGGLRVGR